jgi:hypothetical protein
MALWRGCFCLLSINLRLYIDSDIAAQAQRDRTATDKRKLGPFRVSHGESPALFSQTI